MKTKAVASFFSILGASALFAVDYTWTGGGTDNNWTTPQNWGSTTGYPASASDNAIFPALPAAIAVTVDVSTTNRTVYFRNPNGTTVTIPSDINLHLSNSGSLVLRAEENATIDGDGTLTFSTGDGENWADKQVNPGKTLTISAKITGVPGFEMNGTGGDITLTNPDNDYQGATITTATGSVTVPTVVPNTGVPSPLGQANTFKFKNVASTFRYTGGTAATDLAFLHESGANIDHTIEYTGSGILTLNGSFKSGNDNAHGLIFNITDPNAVIAFNGTYLNGGTAAFGLAKRGPGLLRISSAATHTGNTVFQQGTIEIVSGGTLSSSTLRFQSGRLLIRDGGSTRTLGNVQLEGAGAIEIASGTSATLNLGTLNNSFGTIDFKADDLGGATKIFINGCSQGLIGPWATVNGGADFASYDSTRGVIAATLAKQNVAVHGGVINNDANSNANIVNGGTSGDITLGNATTQVAVLSQEADAPATVAMNNGTLITPIVRVQPAAAALTLNNGTLTAPASANNRLYLANASSSPLTVNATVANRGADAIRVEKTGTGAVLLAGPITHTGGTYLSEGALTVANTADLTWPDGGISGSGDLAKTGAGTLFFPNSANTYSGDTLITGGTASILHSDTFGDKTIGTHVSGTGAIDFIGTGNQSLRLGTEMIYAEGPGPDGNGALRNTGAFSQYEAFRFLTLSGDLGIYTLSRLDVRNINGTAFLNLNGHGIAKKGDQMFGLTNVTVTNDQGTASIDIQEGSVTFEVGTTLTGGTGNHVRIRDGAYFDFYNLASPVNWSLIMDAGARVNTRSGYGTNVNTWTGPVALNGEARFITEGATSDAYTGAITGTGPLVKTGGGLNGVTYLLGVNNTWADGARVENGTLYATAPGSLPGYNTAVTVTGRGALALRVADPNDPANPVKPGFALTDITGLLGNGTFQSTTAAIGFDTAYADLNLTANLPQIGLRKFGPYKLTHTGTAPAMGSIIVYGGTLEIPAHNRYLGEENITVGINPSQAEPLATLALSGDGELTTLDKGNNVSGQPVFTIGDTGRGLLRVTDNAFINGRLIVGNATAGVGAVHQTGGTVHNTGGAGNDGRIGMGGYGYYLLVGGSFINNGYTQLGRDARSIGILQQTAGDFTYLGTYGGSLGISRSGTGVVHTAGGTFTHTGSLWLGDNNDNSSNNGYAELTVTGSAAVDISATVDMGNRNNMTAQLNLNGGTLTANRIHRYNRDTPSRAYVNWNGGTFRARNADAELFTGSVADLYPDVTVYGGGAVIDIPDTGKNKRISTPLRAPTALRIAEIPVVTPGAGYLGAPFVRITGGGGTGASASAHINPADGTLDHIEITSPGTGYTTTPTVTLIGGDPTTPATLDAPVMDYQANGGLLKLGEGTLTLAAANTYTGITEAREGTLILDDPAAISPRSQIAVTGGRLDLNGGVLSNGNVTVTAGSIVNGTLATPVINKTGPGTFALFTPVSKGPAAPATPLRPGLWEGMIRHNWNNWSENPKERVQLTTRAANGGVQAANTTYAGNLWTNGTHTWVYSGYIWNHSTEPVNWTFFGRFDDNMHLLIDGKTLMRNSNNSDLFVTYTLTPGAHPFEARFGDGSGDVGPGPKDRSIFPAGGAAGMSGLLVDYSGQPGSTADLGRFQILQDPGDGSLFTLDIPEPFDGPGLHESVVQLSNNTDAEGSYVSRQLTTRAAIGSNESNATYCDGLWTNGNHTWIYTGYIWNRSEEPATWTFRGRFDDNHYLTINGTPIYSVGNSGVAVESVLMNPGANAIEIRFCDGGGSVGPSGEPYGIAYDPDGTGYRQIIDPGDGSLLTTTADWTPPPPPVPESTLVQVNITEGILSLMNNPAAGLIEGIVTNNAADGQRNITDPNPGNTGIELTTTAANGRCENVNQYINGKLWPGTTSYIYTGYIWNRGPDAWWTFAENFDDNCYLIIDGNIVEPVLDNGGWNVPTKKNVWMTTGAHPFEVRFGQGGGGCAGTLIETGNFSWKTTAMSFGVDFQGRDSGDSDNYEIPRDPGNGTLFTWTLDDLPKDELLDTAQVNIAAGAVLDLSHSSHRIAQIAGNGTVTNGTLAAGSVISPAGDDAIGTLAFGNVTLAPGITYRVTMDGTASDRIESSTPLNISGLTIIPAPGCEPTASLYVIGTAPEFIGTPTLSGFPKKYKVAKRGTNLILTSEGGTIMILK